MTINNKHYIALFILQALLFASCKKEWLEAKPDLKLIEPGSVQDYQSILDNTFVLSSGNSVNFNNNQPSFGEISVAEYYVSDQRYALLTPLEKNAYIWAKDFYAGADQYNVDWNWAYKRIFNTNIILEGLEKIAPSAGADQNAWNNAKGGALFFRGYNHYNIAQLFAKPYEKNSAASEPGIPLKTASDVLAKTTRASVEDTYKLILSDLKQSADLLPISTPINTIYKNRPNKAAAFALLARVYLSMELYDSSWSYADKSLQLYRSLMDFNSNPPVSPASNNSPIQQYNSEVLFSDLLGTYTVYQPLLSTVESSLYNLFTTDDDIRKRAFFRISGGLPNFKGSYWGFYFPFFSGLAVDEVYLTRAECYARKGDVPNAMKDLNDLLRTRWRKVNNVSTYTDQTATNADDALTKILLERRKELCFRGLRWSDLRRLNKDPKYAVTLKRTVNGQTYTLLPNDLKYVLPIPPDVIQLSGIQQNPR